MPKTRAASAFFVVLLGLAGVACQRSANQLVEEAEREALEQRSQLAQHLYSQALKARRSAPLDRLRAYVGLVDLSFNQLHDYRMGVAAALKASEEFKDIVSEPKKMLRDVQFRAAQVARLQLQDEETAQKLVAYFEGDAGLTAEMSLEIARSYMASQNWERSEAELLKAWESAKSEKSCLYLQKIQLDLIQLKVLQKSFQSAIEWGTKEELMEGCRRDESAVLFELAHCYELTGEPLKSLEIYGEILKKSDDKARVEFLMEGVRKRMKEKEVR